MGRNEMVLLHGWGVELPAEEYSKAIAAVGVIEAFGSGVAGGTDVALLSMTIRANLTRAVPRWHDNVNYFVAFKAGYWREKYPEPRALARAWHRAVSDLKGEVHSDEIRVAIPSGGNRTVDWHSRRDVFDVLAHAGAGLDSVVWSCIPGDDTRRSWDFPLRIGLTNEDAMRQLRERAEADGGHYTRLFRYFFLGKETEHCDLLFTSLDPAAISGRRPGRASAVVCLRAWLKPASPRGAFDRSNSLFNSAVLAFIGAPADPVAAVQQILTNLTHDQSLDAALWAAARNSSQLWTTSGEAPAPMVMGDVEFLRQTRLRHVIERAAVQYDAGGQQDTASWMRQIGQSYGFLRESLGATEFVNRKAATKPGLDGARPARWLQAAPSGYHGEPFGDHAPPGCIVQGAWSIIEASIGPKASDEGLPAFPESALGKFDQARLQILLQLDHAVVVSVSDDRHSFDILSSPPKTSREDSEVKGIALTTIVLPLVGESTHGMFALWIPNGTSEVRGRMVVLFQNRAIQSAHVKITAVTKEMTAASSIARRRRRHPFKPLEGALGSIVLKSEGVIRSRTDDIADMDEFDASLVASAEHGVLELTSVRGSEARIRRPNLAGTISGIQSKLEELTRMKEGLIDLGTKWSRDLLWVCAGHGVSLRDYFEEQLGHDLTSCERLQLVSRNDAYLPIEFAYDGEPPSDSASVCKNALQALESGGCGECPHQSSEDHLCPMHFWGLKKIIERHADPGKSAEGEDFVVRGATPTEDVFTPRRLLHAASDRAYRFKGAPRRDDFHSMLAAMVPSAPTVVATWADWLKAVEDKNPNVLFLIPHLDAQNGLDFIEIGAAAQLRKFQIKRSHVGLRDDQPQLVVLLGCRGAQPHDDFATFAGVFRKAGADIVVTTLSSIRGEDALPIGREIARLLGGRTVDLKMGGLMMILRRRLLVAGLPAGLGLVAYGDADWRVVSA
jgi:hypothetical protein